MAARINCCLKATFIWFNLLFTLVGGIIISLAVVCQVLTSTEDGMEGRSTGLIFLYIVGSTTILLSLLGAYGAYKEHKVSLIVFLVCMVFGASLMIRSGIPQAIARPQVEGIMEEKFRSFLPLNSASFHVKHLADTMQTQLHCCGLFNYQDWNDDLPASCRCFPDLEEGCRPVSYPTTMKSKFIYSKPCFPVLLYYINLLQDISLGVVFTLAAIAVLAMVLSSIMIHQLRRPSGGSNHHIIPAIFTPGPPKYQELYNKPPPY